MTSQPLQNVVMQRRSSRRAVGGTVQMRRSAHYLRPDRTHARSASSGAARKGDNNSVATESDQLPDLHNQTRGGEQLGEEYPVDIVAQLPPREGPILEIGVGTGVVPSALRRPGRAERGGERREAGARRGATPVGIRRRSLVVLTLRLLSRR